MKKVILFLAVVGAFSAQSLFAQGNSASHQFIIILPELATLDFQNRNISKEDVAGVSLSYTGSVMQFEDFSKNRNLQVEMVPNEGVIAEQYLEMTYQNFFDDAKMLPLTETIGAGYPVDLPLITTQFEGEFEKSEINFSYKLIEESNEPNSSGFFDVIYTLSEF